MGDDVTDQSGVNLWEAGSGPDLNQPEPPPGVQEDKERFPIQVGPAFQGPSWNLFTPMQDWTKVLNEPHFSSLYIDNAWRKAYTDLPSMDPLRELGVDMDEVSKEAVNRAYLSRVIGVTPEDLGPTYEGWRDQFAQENLGGPVADDAEFFDKLKGQVADPNAAVEFAARFARGAQVGGSSTRAGLYAMVEGALRGEQNPYLEKSTAEAQADVPRLKGEIELAEQEIGEGRAHSGPRGFVPPAGSRAARMGDLKTQLGWAELAAQGQTPENFLGALSRSSGELAEEARGESEQERKLYSNEIVPAHDAWWVMRVADSAGESVPGLAASALNPVFGLSLMYAQTYEGALEEYKTSAEQRGAPFRIEDAERYAHEQALLQTPVEILGDVAAAKVMAKAFRSIPKGVLKEGPETFGKWIAERGHEVSKAVVGEGLVTTPVQTVGESLLAEHQGVRDKTTWGQKGLATLDAMSIALGQVGMTSGASIAAAGGVKGLKGDFQEPRTFHPEAQPKYTIQLKPAVGGQLRFSKARVPHQLALPTGATYKTDDEAHRDPARVLQAILRGLGEADPGQQGKHGRGLASGPSLFAWANEHGADLPHEIFGEFEGGGGEHAVFRDGTGRIVKLTKPGLFGAQAEDAGAYLERMALSNRIFGDDVRLEGVVTLPGEDAPRAVISQSEIIGRDATGNEQADFLKGKGFIEYDHRWVHPVLGVTVWDTITPGNVIVRPDGTMRPIDLQIEPARAEELRTVRELSGIGGPTAFSRGDGGGALPRMPRETRDGSVYKNLHEHLSKVIQKWGLSDLVELSDSAHQVGDGEVKLEALMDPTIKGAYNTGTGKVHLLLDRLNSVKEGEKVLRHEVLHHIFETVLKAEFDKMLEGIRKRIPEGRWNELLRDYPPGKFDDRTRIQEYLAYLGQEDPRTGIFQDAFLWMTKSLRRLGIDIPTTHGDIIDFLQRANREIDDGFAQTSLSDEKARSATGGIRFSKVVSNELKALMENFQNDIDRAELSAEEAGVYDVFINAKERTKIRKKDIETLSEGIGLERGHRRYGAVHILIDHYSGSRGQVTAGEIVQIGRVIRAGKVTSKGDKNLYELRAPDGARLRVIVATKPKDAVITFYSNRK